MRSLKSSICNLQSSILTLLLAAGMLAGTAQGAAKTTTKAGYWTNTTTWVGGSLPQAGDDVVIAHAVTLDQSTPWLASCSNTAAITFIGWNTALQATNVYVNNTITHNVQSQIAPADGVTAPQPLVNGGTYEQWVPDNRVWIICSNLTVAVGQTISVKGKGYAGNSGTGPGSGPGGGKNVGGGGGGGYGGGGGTSGAGTGGYTYGSVTNPVDPGSGGGYGVATFNPLNYGGGAVRIQASGAVAVNGTIDADGIFNDRRQDSGESGNGSGGAIWITCATYQGNGLLRAKGVDSGGNGSGGGAGGGGRIAIEITDTNAQRLVSLSTTPRPIMMALKGNTGGDGTVYVNYPGALPGLFRDYSIPAGMLSWPFAIEWELGSLTVSNVTLNLPLTNYAIHVSNNLLLTNSANLYVYAGITNATWPTYSARIRVDGDMIVSPGCTNYISLANPVDGSTNGGPARFEVANLMVHSGGKISADGLGYAGGGAGSLLDGYGPGGGKNGPVPPSRNERGSGGGHGGKGGDGWGTGCTGGGTYGVSNAPVSFGSGGSYGHGEIVGTAGGGAIWIRAIGTVTANGTISANGPNGVNFQGCGSGGSVFIACKDLIGGTAGVTNITANGGSSTSRGGGGGGRVAVWYNTSLDTLDNYLATGARGKTLTTNAPTGFSGSLSAKGGVAADSPPTYNGADGTQSFYCIPPPQGTVILLQ